MESLSRGCSFILRTGCSRLSMNTSASSVMAPACSTSSSSTSTAQAPRRLCCSWKVDELAARNVSVTINWYYDEEDDTWARNLARTSSAPSSTSRRGRQKDELRALRGRAGGDRAKSRACRGAIVSKVRSHARRFVELLGHYEKLFENDLPPRAPRQERSRVDGRNG